MKCKDAEKLLDDIDKAFSNIKSFSSLPHLAESYFARFLVVFVCGIYEAVIELIINEKVASLGSTQISDYIQVSIHTSFRNPDVENIRSLLKRFDISWEAVVLAVPEKCRVALNSLVQNKNALAHGNPCAITLNDVEQYYQDSKVLIEAIDNTVL